MVAIDLCQMFLLMNSCRCCRYYCSDYWWNLFCATARKDALLAQNDANQLCAMLMISYSPLIAVEGYPTRLRSTSARLQRKKKKIEIMNRLFMNEEKNCIVSMIACVLHIRLSSINKQKRKRREALIGSVFTETYCVLGSILSIKMTELSHQTDKKTDSLQT